MRDAPLARYQISTIKRTNLERPDGQRHAFGDWFVTDVTTVTIEPYREVRRLQVVYKDSKGVDRISGGLVAVNRDLSQDDLGHAPERSVRYADGKAFEIEFMTLDGQTAAVATVEASTVRPVTGWDISHSRHLQSS